MYNLNIPGLVNEEDLKILESLAANVPENGTIVEVGSFLGKSSWCLAKSCKPSVTVYCIDYWHAAEMFMESLIPNYQYDLINIEYFYPELKNLHWEDMNTYHTYSIDKLLPDFKNKIDQLVPVHKNFRKNIVDCDNIIEKNNFLPNELEKININDIDLLFVDMFSKEFGKLFTVLSQFYCQMNKNGILCGHNYMDSNLDTQQVVSLLSKNLNKEIITSQNTSIWQLV